VKDRPAYLPFYIRDFFSDPNVMRLTWSQQAVYWRMLCVSWEMVALPASDLEVARMIGQESLELDVRAVRKLAWKTDSEGNSTNPRLERERAHWLSVHTKKKAGGREGNNRRWGKERSESDPAPADDESDADRSSPEPQPESDRNTQAQEQAQEQEQNDPSASLRSAGAEPAGAGPTPPPEAAPGELAHEAPEPKRRRKAPEGAHAECMRGWDALWVALHAAPFAWDAKHATAMARALKKAQGSVEAVLDRARGLLFDPPDAWTAQNASPALLDSRWNELAGRARKPTRDELRRVEANRDREKFGRAIDALFGEGGAA